MSVSLQNFQLTNTTFDEFYNTLCDIEDYHTSWLDEDYAERNWQQHYQKKITKIYKSKQEKNKEYSKYREIDLRRKLLHRIGKYELEEGEVFE